MIGFVITLTTLCQDISEYNRLRGRLFAVSKGILFFEHTRGRYSLCMSTVAAGWGNSFAEKIRKCQQIDQQNNEQSDPNWNQTPLNGPNPDIPSGPF